MLGGVLRWNAASNVLRNLAGVVDIALLPRLQIVMHRAFMIPLQRIAERRACSCLCLLSVHGGAWHGVSWSRGGKLREFCWTRGRGGVGSTCGSGQSIDEPWLVPKLLLIGTVGEGFALETPSGGLLSPNTYLELRTTH